MFPLLSLETKAFECSRILRNRIIVLIEIQSCKIVNLALEIVNEYYDEIW
jgi:hypothetical protein